MTDPRPAPPLNDASIISHLQPLMSQARIARIEEVLSRRIQSIAAVLDNLHDAQNISAVVRSSEAFGVAELHTIEATERVKLRRRVTQGCQKWIDFYRHEASAPCMQGLKARGFLVLGAEPREGALPITRLPVERKIALVFGGEHTGIRPETRALCDDFFQIPMCGFTRALNASAAAAVSIFAATTRWREHHGAAGDLSEEEKLRLRARFYRDSVRGARLILALGGDMTSVRAQKRRNRERKLGE